MVVMMVMMMVVMMVAMMTVMMVVHYAPGSCDHGYASGCGCGYNDDFSGSLCLCRLKSW